MFLLISHTAGVSQLLSSPPTTYTTSAKFLYRPGRRAAWAAWAGVEEGGEEAGGERSAWRGGGPGPPCARTRSPSLQWWRGSSGWPLQQKSLPVRLKF